MVFRVSVFVFPYVFWLTLCGCVRGASCSWYDMPSTPRSTNNSLSAGVSSKGRSGSSATTSTGTTSASTGSASPLSADSIAEAVVRALGSSLPTIFASIQGNAPSSNSAVPGSAASVASPNSSSSTVGSTDVNISSTSSTPSSGTITLPAFVPTFTPGSAITDSSSARLVAPTFFSTTHPVS